MSTTAIPTCRESLANETRAKQKTKAIIKTPAKPTNLAIFMRASIDDAEFFHAQNIFLIHV